MIRISKNVLIIVGLVVGTLVLYGRTARFDFVNLDDGEYVYENPNVSGGLTAHNIGWALTSGEAANWHPVTWWSLMLDAQIFGPKPGPMHLHNTILHSINAALVFALLWRLTGLRWASAWAAALFAWHPVHVESVAWISERKDVLSTLFMLLCLLAYTEYVARPRKMMYGVVVATLILGLMAKPMLVTLPFVMLLLDVWPLRRFTYALAPSTAISQASGDAGLVQAEAQQTLSYASPGMRRKSNALSLLFEKLPLFGIVAASAVVTYLVQSAGHSVAKIPMGMRLANVVVSYGRYLWMTVAPRGLAIFYPMPSNIPGAQIPAWQTITSGCVLIGITVIALLMRKRLPALLMGWLWYLGTLVPVIGLIAVGSQSHADRYTYVPLIGIFLALGCCGTALAEKWRMLRPVIVLISIATVIGAATLSQRQIGFWRDTGTVMQHAIDVVPNNYLAYRSLGQTLDSEGNRPAADEKYNQALAINPKDSIALRHLAIHAMDDGNIDEAGKLFRRAMFTNPGYGPGYNNYANVLIKQGRTEDAIQVYRRGLERDPGMKEGYHNLALALAEQGKIDEAIKLWQQAVKIDPDYADAHASLGPAQLMTGRTREGIADLRAALRVEPDRIDVLNSLAWVLATHPNALYQDGAEAEKLAARAVELSKGENPISLDTLAAAQARQQRFDEAVKTAQQGLELAKKQNLPAIAGQIEKRVALYRDHRPFTSGK